MKAASLAILLSAGLFTEAVCAGERATFDRTSIAIETADHRRIVIAVEVAAAKAQKEAGLMNRRTLPADEGMLFVLGESERLGVWMKNTYIPLTVAFFRPDGTIMALHHLTPHDETPIWADEEGRWMLEMNQGWFERNDIKVGDRMLLQQAPSIMIPH